MCSRLFTSLDFGILEFYGTLYESFQQACETMMNEFKGCIPEGSLQARIRATKRETTTPERAGEDIIGSTLADEAIGRALTYHHLGHSLLTSKSEVGCEALSSSQEWRNLWRIRRLPLQVQSALCLAQNLNYKKRLDW